MARVELNLLASDRTKAHAGARTLAYALADPVRVLLSSGERARLNALSGDRVPLSMVTMPGVLMDPELSQLFISAVDFGSGFARITVFDTITTNAPCEISFRFVAGKKIISTAFSDPDQNSPHSIVYDVTDQSCRGIEYRVDWRWRRNGETPSAFVATGYYLTVPDLGDPSDGIP